MTTPHTVRYQLGYLCGEIDQLIREDEEVFDGRGHDSLIDAKNDVIEAIKGMTDVINRWRGKE